MGESNEDPLAGFGEFGRWMWRNREFAELVEWLREHNRTATRKVSVYGLDLQGTDETHPRVAKNAERFRRALSSVAAWNIRDRHMAATVDLVQRDLVRRTGTGKIVVWAHNSHIGDARATSRARYGELSLGQLVREHWPDGATFSVGFTTESGTVLAAPLGNMPPRVQNLRPSQRGSHGEKLSAVGLPRFLLLLDQVVDDARRPFRAIGVMYQPAVEYQRHFINSRLPNQFDAIVHIEETTALTPLD